MFTNQHHLRHLLRPDQYTSEAQYRLELRHLFRPAWHPLAVKSDLAKPGDFLTFDLPKRRSWSATSAANCGRS